MRWNSFGLLAILIPVCIGGNPMPALAESRFPMSTPLSDRAGNTAYQFSLISIDGRPLRLADFAGKPMLIVNTASFCGYTYQYEALQRVWTRYRDRGLVVLGIPSGDFANQEYDSNGEIKTFCQTRFDVDFPMTEKVHVRGKDADPLFVWLRAQLGDGPGPLWNFHKYLIDANGRAVASFPSALDPDHPDIVAAIERLLPPAKATANTHAG